MVERTSVSRLPTKWGLFQAFCYSSKLDGTEHVAVVKVRRKLNKKLSCCLNYVLLIMISYDDSLLVVLQIT